MTREGSELVEVIQPNDRSAGGGNQVEVSELGKLTAHSLDGQPQTVADIAAGHWQGQPDMVALHLSNPIGHCQQEICNSFLS